MSKEATGPKFCTKATATKWQDLDPQFVNSVSSLNVISALLEGLASEDPHDLHPISGVAESWEISLEEKIYTFHLRHNAKWPDSEPVIAQKILLSPIAVFFHPTHFTGYVNVLSGRKRGGDLTKVARGRIR